MKALALSLLFASVATAALAEDRSIDLVGAIGRCTTFTIGTASYGCTKLLYAHFPNGRTGFNIVTDRGAIMLSGGRDHQPDPTTYLLEIDTLRFGSADGRSREQRAAGECVARLSIGGAYLHSLSCRAVAGSMPVTVGFVGNGSKVSVSHF